MDRFLKIPYKNPASRPLVAASATPDEPAALTLSEIPDDDLDIGAL